MLWVVFILSALIAYVVTKFSIMFSLRRGVLDVPNLRSSHSQPVPRLGGIGILAAFIICIAVFWLISMLGWSGYPAPTRNVFFILLAGTGMAATGLYDDFYGMRPSTKLFLQVAFAGMVVLLGIHFENVTFLHWGPFPLGLVAFPLTILWLAAFANVFNFMDGINGLAAVTGAVYSGFLFVIARQQGTPEFVVPAVIVAGSCIGFLSLNFPRARTFMGDTGSLFLGMVLALFVARFAQKSPNPASLMGLCLVYSVYLWDSGLTLVRRLCHGENIFQAHSNHLYQRLAQLGLSHVRITGLYFLLHILMGFLGFFYVSCAPELRPLILAFAVLILLGFTLSVYLLEGRAARQRPPAGGGRLQGARE